MKPLYCKLILLIGLATIMFGGVFVTAAFGQVETGTINGTVTDPSGAVVPKVKVAVTNTATAATRIVETDTGGFYSVPNLPPGVYSVSFEAASFAKLEKQAEVVPGARVSLNVQLTVGPTTATVEVVASGGVQVNTETQTLGTVVDRHEIESLPTLTRNPYDFAVMAPTASDADPSGRGVMGLSFNGLRSAGTNILLDGAANNDEFVASVGQQVPLDSVQEYSLLTNNFTAEYGRATSGVVNVTTKSGTNDFHGSAYEYNRVSALASNGFYNDANGLPKPVYVRNQFGYSIGGPIKKDKLFFFNNTEWIRIRSSSNQVTYVPDAALVAAAAPNVQSYFSTYGKVRPNTTTLGVATIGDLESAGVCSSGPCAALPSTTPAFDKIQYSVPADSGAGSPQNTYMVVGNVDYNFTDNTTFSAKYDLYKETDFAGTISQSPYQGFDTGQVVTNNRASVSMTHIFSSRFTSQSRLVFNRLNTFQPLGTQPAITGLFFSPNSASELPLGGISGLGAQQVGMPGYLPFTPGNGIPFGGPQNFVQAYQDMSYVKGRHTFRFGGSYDYIRDNRTFGAYETPIGAFQVSGANVSNASLNNFLNGQWAQFQGAIYPQGNYPCPYPITAGMPCTNPANGQVDALGDVNLPVTQPVFARSNRYDEFAFYGQDSWKVSNHVTLNLGLRWEYFGIQHNKNPLLDSNFYLGNGGSLFQEIRNGAVAVAPQSPVGGLWAPDWNNFGPHLGFAWDVFGNGKTSLRGGYAIAYERNFGNVTFNVIQNPPNYAVVSVITGIDIASDPVTPDPSGPLAGAGGVKALPAVSLRAVNPNIRTSYAHLYSMSLEHQVAHNFVVGLDYSGSKGEKQYDIANINRPGSGNVYLGDTCPSYPCPISDLTRLKTSQYSNINYRSDLGNSLYNAMVVRATMTNFANTGLTLNTNFTWSHTWDELSDTFSSSFNEFNLGYLDPFNPRVDYGDSYMDIRKRFVLGAVWDVPLGKDSHGAMKEALSGWQFSPIVTAESGSPFSLYDCTNALQVCPYAFNAAGTSGLPRTGTATPTSTPDVFNYGNFFSSSGTPLYDSSYFNPIAGVSDFGPYPSNMIRRNWFRAPGLWHFNLGAYKTFQLTERFKLQLRGEFYNIFNHSNLYLNVNNVDVSAADPVANPSITASKGFNYNGFFTTDNRNLQFALRLMF